MPGTGMRVRAWLRAHRRRGVVVAVLVGIVAGLGMGLVAGTRRTGSAPDRFTRHAGGDPELVVTQLAGAPISAAVAQLPGVGSANARTFVPAFLRSPADGTVLVEPNPYVGDGGHLGAHVVEGRFPRADAPDEFSVNRRYAQVLSQQFGTRVGDRFEVVAFSQEQVATNFSTIDEPAVAPFTATLVGVTESPAAFDDLSQEIVFSPAFLGAHPEVGVVQTAVAVRLEAGADRQAVIDGVRQLPGAADAFVESRRIVSDSARRAVRFQVTALWLVSGLALLAGGVITAQLIGSAVRLGEDERRSMSAIGWRSIDLGRERALEAALLGAVAAPVALIVASAVGARFPLGVLRLFEPDPGIRADWLVGATGVVALLGVAALTCLALGARTPRSTPLRPAPRTALSATGNGVWFVMGARFAMASHRRRFPYGSLLGGALCVGGLVGSIVVGTSLNRIVDRPARWGINYDRLLGNPFTDAHTDIVGPIAAHPDVVAATGATLGSVLIDGADIRAIALAPAKGSLTPTVLQGRAPVADDEIGVCGEVARRLGLDLDRRVDVAGATGEVRRMTVVGIVVTPDQAGNGAALTFDAYAQLHPTATQNVALVRFRDGTPPAVIDTLAATNYTPPDSLTTPTSVRALERVAGVPFVLALVLLVLLLLSGAYLLGASVRRRWRDLAIVRALGADRRQARTIVHWQATMVAAATALAGLPLGLLAGAWTVSLLTDALGIVPGVDRAPLALAALALGGLGAANVLALLPAHRAVQQAPARTLSSDR